MSEVKFPKVHVDLVGEDGNAFAILGRVSRAMRQAHVPLVDIEEYHKEATSGDYDHLLQVTMQTVSCDAEEEDDEYYDDDLDDDDDDDLWDDEQEEE
jgi:hypothetical protein